MTKDKIIEMFEKLSNPESPIRYAKFSNTVYNTLKESKEYSSIYGIPIKIDDNIKDALIVFYNNFDEVINIIVWESD